MGSNIGPGDQLGHIVNSFKVGSKQRSTYQSQVDITTGNLAVIETTNFLEASQTILCCVPAIPTIFCTARVIYSYTGITTIACGLTVRSFAKNHRPLVNQQALIDRLYLSHVNSRYETTHRMRCARQLSFVPHLSCFHVAAVAGTEPTRCQLLFKTSLDGRMVVWPTRRPSPCIFCTGSGSGHFGSKIYAQTTPGLSCR